MGLDMYLTGELYIGGQYQHRKVKGDYTFSMDGKEMTITSDQISQIELSIGYWRKANAIHNWFVKEVQGGVDDCQRSHVSEEKLEELKEQCLGVLKNKEKAAEGLPTQSGFFFGQTAYNEYYFEELEETVTIIDKALGLSKKYGIQLNFYYQSSW